MLVKKTMIKKVIKNFGNTYFDQTNIKKPKFAFLNNLHKTE